MKRPSLEIDTCIFNVSIIIGVKSFVVKNVSEIFRPKNFDNCSKKFSSVKNFVLFWWLKRLDHEALKQWFWSDLTRNYFTIRIFWAVFVRNSLVDNLISLIQGTACYSCSLWNSVIRNVTVLFRSCLSFVSVIWVIAACLRFYNSYLWLMVILCAIV